ncbi:helix-turn-helix domain-containing protein [Streptosporangium sp. G11]|uniref:helix-turn-helix domain-containing protein n=1 Tax=Streptosporangium sp. G11 TaxID=3436926 RepID=UPI003EBAC35F
MSGHVQQARQGLGARLREIRKDARLSGRALATLAGWHPSKVTRIELGVRNASEETCGCGVVVVVLIASSPI